MLGEAIDWLRAMGGGERWVFLAACCCAVMAVGLAVIRAAYFREDPSAGHRRRPAGELEPWMREPSGENPVVDLGITTTLPADRLGLRSTWREDISPVASEGAHRAPAPDEATRVLRMDGVQWQQRMSPETEEAIRSVLRKPRD